VIVTLSQGVPRKIRFLPLLGDARSDYAALEAHLCARPR